MPVYLPQPKRMTTHFFDRTAGDMLTPPSNRSVRRTAMMGPNGLYAVRTEERLVKDGKVIDRNAFAFPVSLLDSFTRYAAYNKNFAQAYEELMEFESVAGQMWLAGEHQEPDTDPSHIFNIDALALIPEPAFPGRQ